MFGRLGVRTGQGTGGYGERYVDEVGPSRWCCTYPSDAARLVKTGLGHRPLDSERTPSAKNASTRGVCADETPHMRRRKTSLAEVIHGEGGGEDPPRTPARTGTAGVDSLVARCKGPVD